MNFSKDSNSSSGLLIPILIVVALGLVVGGFLISQFTDSAFPVKASAEAEQVDQLFKVLLGIGGAIFLLVEGLLLYSVIRYRTPAHDMSDGPTIHGNVTLEMVWTAIPAVIVLFLVIYSYQVWTDIRAPKDNELVVEVTGARFAWTFSYTDDRVDQKINSNVLHTYAGRPMRMVMHTNDVIHSFWIPAMRIKQDLLPGRTTEISFTPTEPGEYRVVCAELCGGGHGNMFATIVVHPDEETYMTFIDQQVDQILNPPEDPALRGAQLLAAGAYPCSGCHTLQAPEAGIDWNGTTGPNLNGVGDRAPSRVSGQTAEEYLYTSIYDTDAYLVAGFGNLMNQFQKRDPAALNYFPSEDAQAVVAFLCTLTSDGQSVCDLENLAAYAESFNP